MKNTNTIAMRKLIFIGLLYLCTPVSAQFFDDFSSKSSEWKGDTNQFFINGDEVLQLDASKENQSSLYRSVPYLDTAIWFGTIVLDFPPSASNRLVIYLWQEPGTLDGLFFELGESGSQDSLRIFYRQNGKLDQMASLFLPTFSTDEVNFVYRMSKEVDQYAFSIFSGSDTSKSLFSITPPQFPFDFKIECNYTSSRSDKFYFDDLGVGKTKIDITAPEFIGYEFIDSQVVAIYFDENITLNTTFNITSQPALTIKSAQSNGDLLVMELEQPLTSGELYVVNIEGLSDVSGNYYLDTIELIFFETHLAEPYEILITEIFPDPSPVRALPECEFVELYNNSNHFFNLNEYTLADAGKQVFLPDYILSPGQYIIICELACRDAFLSFGDVIGVDGLPNFNNDGDVVSIVDYVGRPVHQVAYDRSWYQFEERSQGGWSLEMKHPDLVCFGKENWSAGALYECGSPGKRNTNYLIEPWDKELRVQSSELTSDTMLSIDFNQQLYLDQNKMVINVDPQISTRLVNVDGRKMNFIIENKLEQGRPYELKVSDVSTCLNEISEVDYVGDIYLPRPPDSGELVINEVLFNPSSGGIDFVEIINTSSAYIHVERSCLEVLTTADTSYACMGVDLNLGPGELVALASDTAILKSYYTCGEIQILDLPNMPDDKAEVSLFYFRNGKRFVLDRMKYHEKWHSPVLKDVNGVSLEKVNYLLDGRDNQSWHSAASTVGFATPGLPNSQYIMKDSAGSTVFLSSTSFSPNGDGYKDVLSIDIHLEKAGYNLRSEIYDIDGRYVGLLSNNELAGVEQSLYWDGADDNGRLQPIGLYLILIELAHPDGELKREKAVVVLN